MLHATIVAYPSTSGLRFRSPSHRGSRAGDVEFHSHGSLPIGILGNHEERDRVWRRLGGDAGDDACRTVELQPRYRNTADAVVVGSLPFSEEEGWRRISFGLDAKRPKRAGHHPFDDGRGAHLRELGACELRRFEIGTRGGRVGADSD